MMEELAYSSSSHWMRYHYSLERLEMNETRVRDVT